ncbi:MAG: formylglycine-generating enzyme family protein, partial [Cyanobium sp.]
DFGELISGPAKRSNLELQSGLRERLVSDSGGGDALPLLAFTLEKLWQKWKDRGGPIVSPRGERWDLTVADYEGLGGVAGAVSSQAKLCWDPQTGSEADAAALQQAFVDHLLTLNEEGVAAKRAARLRELPERSQPLVTRMGNRRLLVSDAGVVEIAHEALLRTWEPLVGWIEANRKQLEQRRRVARLCGDLALKQPVAARLAALQGLLALGETDPGVMKLAADAVGDVLRNPERDPREEPLAIQLLDLVGGEAAVVALSAFLEQRQIPELLETVLATPRLDRLCKAAAAIQRIHRRTPPAEDGEARWLLLPSATMRDDGGAVRTELVRLRLWATPSPSGSNQAPGASSRGVALTMVSIPAGRFVMGSPPEEEERAEDEGPQHLVELEGFWMSQTPITQAQWRQVMESNPSHFSDNPESDQRPVEQVSWHEAMEFCQRLSERLSRNYTLPSEAQWEYACRAGSSTP